MSDDVVLSMIEAHAMNTARQPDGGRTFGHGFTIAWQRGPLGRGPTRKSPNGAFVEDIIEAVIGRLDFYQNSEFVCEENTKALYHLRRARDVLNERTKERERRGVEGTHIK